MSGHAGTVGPWPLTMKSTVARRDAATEQELSSTVAAPNSSAGWPAAVKHVLPEGKEPSGFGHAQAPCGLGPIFATLEAHTQ